MMNVMNNYDINRVSQHSEIQQLTFSTVRDDNAVAVRVLQID